MDSIDQTLTPAVISPRCPISFAMSMLGDRWSLLIIRDMMLFGKRRYSEFLASGEGISTNILADRLKQMQHLDLVEKFSDPTNRKASVYLLTDKGLRLFPTDADHRLIRLVESTIVPACRFPGRVGGIQESGILRIGYRVLAEQEILRNADLVNGFLVLPSGLGVIVPPLRVFLLRPHPERPAG